MQVAEIELLKKEVTVDECPKCAGIWMDHGELGQIRSQFDSEEERKKAAESYFQEIFGNQLEKMRKESQEKAPVDKLTDEFAKVLWQFGRASKDLGAGVVREHAH